MEMLSTQPSEGAWLPTPFVLGAKAARWLRVVWLLGLLASITLAIVATLPLHAHYQTTCPDALCDLLPQLNATTAALLARLGLPLAGYAALMVGVEWLYFALWAAIGVVILWKQPGNPVGLLLAMIGLFVGPSAFLRVFAETYPGFTLPGQLQRFFGGSAALVLLFALFPDGRWVPRWARWVVLLAFIEGFVSSFIAPGWSAVAPLPYFIWAVLLWGFLLGAQVYRYRRVATQLQRQQAKWVLFGVGLFVLNLVVVIGSFTLGLAERFQLLILLTCYGATSVMTLAFAFAILRHRLFAIDVILNRALVYALLTALVAATYVLVVGGLGALLQAQDSLILSLLATGLVAVLFQPLREQIQRGVDYLLYGRRGEPYTVVAQLGERLEAVFTPNAILPTITATLAESLRLPYVAIVLNGQEPAPIAAATGAPVGAPVAFPLQYQGAIVGRLLVCPRRGETELSLADRRLLGELAQQAGAAVHGVRLMDELRRLNADLQRSRERLVLAREEERQRIRRDLHDDLAPTLAGLALDADTIADLVALHPERAQARARTLNVQIRAAVGGIRQLVHDLRPPTLDEYGLLAAVRERAAQLGAAGRPTMRVEAPDLLPPLPAAVEVAAYRIVQEALMNVLKHADARHCTVTVVVGEALEIVVADDGVGMVPAQVPGVGLRSMRERAEELGGSLVIGAGMGTGTLVQVWLPVRKEDAP